MVMQYHNISVSITTFIFTANRIEILRQKAVNGKGQRKAGEVKGQRKVGKGLTGQRGYYIIPWWQ